MRRLELCRLLGSIFCLIGSAMLGLAFIWAALDMHSLGFFFVTGGLVAFLVSIGFDMHLKSWT